MVADLPGWENPRPRKRTKTMPNDEQPFANAKVFAADKDRDFKLGNNSPRYGNSQDGNPDTPDIPVTGTNIDPYLAIGASVLTFVGGAFLVPKGYISTSALAQIITAVLSLAATCFVAYKGTTKSKIVSLAKTIDVPKNKLAGHIVALKNNYAANRKD